MPSKKKSTKGEAKGSQGKGKANGQAKVNGKAETKLPGSCARFKGDFSANAEIRARAP
jgi:predicted nucleic acid binding AN1-type Zn finger protein